MSLKLRAFNFESDFTSQRQLFRLCFPETEDTPIVSDEYYYWKFQSYPNQKMPSLCYVSENDGEICGSYSALPFQYSVRGKIVKCGMVCDVMTHPEYRGQGIFTKLGRYATEEMAASGMDFVSGYPIRPEVIPGHLKVGWQIAFKAPIYVRPIKIDSFTGATLFKFFNGPLNFFLRIFNKLSSVTLVSGYSACEVSKENFLEVDTYSRFFEEWASQCDNYLVKSPEYLAWRTSAPGTQYHFLKLYYGDTVVGAAIVRPVVLKGIPSLAILDLMISKEHRRAVTLLHNQIKSVAEREKCHAVAIMINSPWQRKYRLFSNFYFRTPAVFSIIFKRFNPNLNADDFQISKRWHLTWIDSDDL